MIPKAIRHLQVSTSPGVGGRELVVPMLAEQLKLQGHESWILCRPQTLIEKLAREKNLPVELTAWRGYFDPFNILRVARFLKTRKIQIIHSHWSRDLSNLILASGLAGSIPIVLTKHVYSTENKRDPFHAWVYHHVDKIIGVSQLVTENLLQTLRVPAEKVVTIYNGLDMEREWNPEHVVAWDLYPELNIPPGAPILGYAGRLNRGKGPHFILEAFSHLAEEYPEWHLVFVGKAVGTDEEAYARDLTKQAVAQGLEKRMHLAGYRLDMPATMRALDILVCASEFESFGMVLVEAMAMERPVIGPASGGVPEIILPGKNGELFPWGDTQALIRILRPWMANAALRNQLGKNGRQLAQEKFSLRRMAEEVVEVFRTVLSNRVMKKS